MASNSQKAAVVAIAASMAAGAEGLRQYAYYDPPGILTVCYGHTGGVEKGKKYTLDECRSLLNADMAKAVDLVDRCVPGLPENVLAAFSDAVYNMGPKIACDPANSRAARLLKQGTLQAACDELPKWDKARVGGLLVSLPGLTKRREAERQLCLAAFAGQ